MNVRLADYLQDPCGTLSIPWWKHRSIALPDHLRIVHERDFDPACFADWEDRPYFRLRHDLVDIDVRLPEGLIIRQATREDFPGMVDLINACYTDLSVTLEELIGCTRTPVYAKELWLLVIDCATGDAVGCGMADFDPEVGEGMLEWIQVLPAYRRRHIGSAIVGQLLGRLRGRAAFVTVSGKVQDPTCPEKLYRACGFTGEDVWHALTKKRRS